MSFIDARVVSTPDGKKLPEKLDEVGLQIVNTQTAISGTINVDQYSHLVVSGDWQPAIQAAIDDAFAFKAKEVRLNSGEYLIKSHFKMKSGVKLIGSGNPIIKASLDVWTKNHTMVELFNVNDSLIKNITFDQQGSLRTSANPIEHILFLSNANDNVIEDVYLLDGGLDPASTGSRISGAPLQIVGKDAEDDRSEGIIGSCMRNKFIRVKIKQTGSAICQFATRVLTNWTKVRPLENYVNLVSHNIFDACEFEGDYEWNHLEFAGTGTVRNTVKDCIFKGKTLTSIDFDKGASYNTAINNRISDGGKPVFYSTDPDNRLAPLHDHGLSSAYRNRGNKFLYNEVVNCVSDSTETYAAGIGISYSIDSLVQGNLVDNINNSNYGAGVLIGRDCSNIQIVNNTLRKVLRGIRTDLNGSNIERIIVKDNTINSVNNGVLFGGSTAQSAKRVTIENNDIICTTGEGIMITDYALAALVSKNNISAGTDGIKTKSLNARISENTLHHNATYGFRLEENCVLLANTIIGTITSPTVVTTGKTVKTSLNSWE